MPAHMDPIHPISLTPDAALEPTRPHAESPRVHPAKYLVVIDGESLGLRVRIGSAPVVIGRGSSVDLQVRDPTVSRHHCVLWSAGGRCWVRDLGSTNQTRVNDRASSMAELFEGDVIVVGHTALMLASDGGPASEAATHAGRRKD